MVLLVKLDIFLAALYWAWLITSLLVRLAPSMARRHPWTTQVARDLWWVMPVAVPMHQLLLPLLIQPGRGVATILLGGAVSLAIVGWVWWTLRPPTEAEKLDAKS